MEAFSLFLFVLLSSLSLYQSTSIETGEQLGAINNNLQDETFNDLYLINKRSIEETGFDTQGQKILLDLHNLYRSNVTPPAANMAFMEWDDELAKLSKEFSDKCIFQHYRIKTTYPGPLGQNLYQGADPTGKRGMWMFYEEHYGYDFRTQKCTWKACGHYLQMAYASSTRVGCGITKCGAAYLMACHYSPPAYVGEPYEVGKPCSQCPVPGSLCYNNTCLTPEQCKRHPELCEKATCELECHNCGRLDKDKCVCECKDGWDSPDCSRACIDRSEHCGRSPGWPNKYACSLGDYKVGTYYCRKMCESCRAVNTAKMGSNVCCRGKICPQGYVLDTENVATMCSCRVLCPGPNCHTAEEKAKFAEE